jgi:hypothetical protein
MRRVIIGFVVCLFFSLAFLGTDVAQQRSRHSSGVGPQALIPQIGWRMDGFNPQRANQSGAIGPASRPAFHTIASNVTGSTLCVNNSETPAPR